MVRGFEIVGANAHNPTGSYTEETFTICSNCTYGRPRRACEMLRRQFCSFAQQLSMLPIIECSGLHAATIRR